MKIIRINSIKKMLEEEHHLSINHLCDVFNVSKNTIRRDIAELDKQGLINKVYGGITLKETDSIEPFTQRETKNASNKQRAAKMAASLVNDNDIIFIDSGTTTFHMIPYLADKKNLTIITASVNIINAAIAYSNSKTFNLIATGGTLYYPSMSFVGPSVLHCLDNYNTSKIFLASTGISIENGATNASIAENEIKQKLIQKTGEKHLLIDSSKLDVTSLMTYCSLSDLDSIILDRQAPDKYVQYCKKNHVQLLVAPED
ncbi:DeoR/GlpR family DNA-binding transcription regulator [uncultured Megasphaera sp.]|uniref:DeoR/GlpR family DNA-binding transcription regulator n=1 Tax=uncultured Megasphaera sp. TaxID=165188 RepID=UPI0025E74FC2|nr:DeoR/GlpR family DNA-binding transcription regulator [uncultured Megasphaera sp.]